jgi:hypothetical protein
MLYPAYELAKTYPRDRWLIKHYRPPTADITFKNERAPLLPGGITYVTGFQQARGDDDRISAPEKLIDEVDQAYFRESLRNYVNRWFDKHGFDRTQPIIPKQQFEAAVQAEVGQVPPEPKISQPMIADHVKNYFDNTEHPTMDDCVSKWPHGSSARDLVRQRYRAEAKSRKIPVKRGPRQNSAK